MCVLCHVKTLVQHYVHSRYRKGNYDCCCETVLLSSSIKAIMHWHAKYAGPVYACEYLITHRMWACFRMKKSSPVFSTQYMHWLQSCLNCYTRASKSWPVQLESFNLATCCSQQASSAVNNQLLAVCCQNETLLLVTSLQSRMIMTAARLHYTVAANIQCYAVEHWATDTDKQPSSIIKPTVSTRTQPKRDIVTGQDHSTLSIGI